ncbi:hypothetical protein [Mangrovactinospora gilvigrisea]|uniref:hypothetical protein n=1 Tax=Mangrovactinospora gilvigrisea TaxID=1428644 RepID=UPI000AD4F7B4|nr:hypothetical protein [Mangrovactinospora gilvigrisea]
MACRALADTFGTTTVRAGIAVGMAAIAVLDCFMADLRKIDDLEDTIAARTG